MISSIVTESAESSCEALILLIADEEDARKREVLLLDLMHKSAELRADIKNEALVQGFSSLLPRHLLSMLKRHTTMTAKPEITPLDVAIVTVTKPELLAAKLAFDVDADANPERIARGYHFYRGSFGNRRDPARPYSFVLTNVGADRNLPCNTCIHALLSLYRPSILVLVGIAAGNAESFRLGDVIAANTVIDIAGGRAEVDRDVPRPESFKITPETNSHLSNYIEEWKGSFPSLVEKLKAQQEAPLLPEPWLPAFKVATLVASERLIADGSMTFIRTQYHDKAVALDMESSGFAQACQSENIPWIVFRGISDFADPDSKNGAGLLDPKRKSWQSYAALAAGWIARDFLASRFRSDKL